jgi:hypothetical protein
VNTLAKEALSERRASFAASQNRMGSEDSVKLQYKHEKTCNVDEVIQELFFVLTLIT